MLIPIHDDHPRACRPVVSWVALAVLVVVTGVNLVATQPPWLAPLGLQMGGTGRVFGFGKVIFFFHALWLFGLHWVLADSVEDRLGRMRFALLYAATGILGVAGQALVSWPAPGAFAQATLAMVAVAYWQLYPRRNITFAVLGGTTERRSWWEPIVLPARLTLGIWFLVQIVVQGMAIQEATSIALVMGCLAGGVTGVWMRRLGHADPDPPAAHKAVFDRSARGQQPGNLAGGARRQQAGNLAGGARDMNYSSTADSPPGATLPMSAYLETDSSHDAALAVPAPTKTHSHDPYTVRGRDDPETASAHVWAVYRTVDEPIDLPRLARIVARTTGEVGLDVARRLRHGRGLLATELDRAGAERLVADLDAARVPAAAQPWSSDRLPAATLVAELAWSEHSVAFTEAGGPHAWVRGSGDDRGDATHDYPWRRVLLAIAYQRLELPPPKLVIDFEHAPVNLPLTHAPRPVTIVELLIHVGAAQPPLRARIHETSTRLPGSGRTAMLRELARTLISRRTMFSVDRGLDVLAGRGFWGHLRFESESQIDLYLSWLLLRHGARQGGSLHYLE